MLNAPVFADGLDDITQGFLVESYENFDERDRALVALEKEPNSRLRRASIFRTIHLIKGTSGFPAFNRLEAVAHVGENVLSEAARRSPRADARDHPHPAVYGRHRPRAARHHRAHRHLSGSGKGNISIVRPF